MSIGLYLFLTFLFVMMYLVNKEDKKQEKAKKFKKPNLNEMHRRNTSEIRDMFRESKSELDKEYEKFLRKE